MLIRPTTDDTYECIFQEHHALVSGLLAGAWAPTRLDPLLVQSIGMHDNPWRPVDASPTYSPETGLPHDFLTYPVEEKIDFYRDGIDALESVHPWTAYLISLHYTTFAGTKDVAALTNPEQRRRERLELELTEDSIQASDEALAWMKFFDVFSLYLCLTGPRAVDSEIPGWLRDPTVWSQAPDETELELEWRDDETLALAPWPFARPEFPVDLHMRVLDEKIDDASEMEEAWTESERTVREVVLERRGA